MIVRGIRTAHIEHATHSVLELDTAKWPSGVHLKDDASQLAASVYINIRIYIDISNLYYRPRK